MRDFFALFFAGFFAAFVFARDAEALRAELDRFEAATLPRPLFAVGRLEVLRLPAREADFARDFLAFEAIVVLPGVDRERGRAAGTARTGLSGSTSWRPRAFPRIWFSKNGGESGIGIHGAHNNIDPRGER